jgi:peptidoglycan/xylan/chitin deacetylase (PgdA/CDA1 family)
MILKSISFGTALTVAIVLITILMGVGADFSVPEIAYSQSVPSVPSVPSVSSVPTSDSINTANNNNKAVILTFDDGYKSQYTNAKPILDKYGYKATSYIVCEYVGGGEGQVHPNVKMTWEEIIALHNEGHDIGSHTMSHDDLDSLSEKGIEYEVGGSKECLFDHGIIPTSFSYPTNTGAQNAAVVNTVAKYYDIARTANDPLMYLHCDGFKEESTQTDCRTFSDDGELNFVNRYSILGWSHDAERKDNSYSDSQMLDRFIEVVNSQSTYNTDGKINAIPIIIWHRIDNSGVGDPEQYATTIDLFEKEIKYLHDNGFKVLTMADLGYDEKSNYLYIKK